MIDNSRQFKKVMNASIYVVFIIYGFYLLSIATKLFNISFDIKFLVFFIDLFKDFGFGSRIIFIGFIIYFYLYFKERPIKKLSLQDKIIEHLLIAFAFILAFYIDDYFKSLLNKFIVNLVFIFTTVIGFRRVKDMYPFLSFSSFNLNTDQKEKDKRFPLDKQPKNEQLMFPIKANNGTSGWLNIENPFQGIAVVGNAGAGKTYSVLNPILRQLPSKNFSGYIYDVKYPEQTNVLYRSWLNNKTKSTKFFVLNFTDLKHSHRANPLSPEIIIDITYCQEYCETLLKNLNTEWIKRPDFWYLVSHSMVSSCLWFLKRNEPDKCTLPHLTSLLLNNIVDVVTLLKNDPDCAEMVNAIDGSIKRKAEGQLSGTESSYQEPFKKINTRSIFWVLSGNDFSFNLNDPSDPKLLCVGNYIPLRGALSPVISLISTVAIKFLNMPKKHHSVFFADEIPTLFVPNLDQLPATGRSNKVATILGFQDYSQNEDMWGRDKARVLNANLSNQFVGQVTDIPTAESICKYFGQDDIQKVSQSFSDNDSYSISTQRQNNIEVTDLTTQKLGHFAGKLSTGTLFSCNIIANGCKTDETLPSFCPILEDPEVDIEHVLEDNFVMIKNDIKEIILKYENKAKLEISQALNNNNEQFVEKAVHDKILFIDLKKELVIYKDYHFSFKNLDFNPQKTDVTQNN